MLVLRRPKIWAFSPNVHVRCGFRAPWGDFGAQTGFSGRKQVSRARVLYAHGRQRRRCCASACVLDWRRVAPSPARLFASTFVVAGGPFPGSEFVALRPQGGSVGLWLVLGKRESGACFWLVCSRCATCLALCIVGLHSERMSLSGADYVRPIANHFFSVARVRVGGHA